MRPQGLGMNWLVLHHVIFHLGLVLELLYLIWVWMVDSNVRFRFIFGCMVWAVASVLAFGRIKQVTQAALF